MKDIVCGMEVNPETARLKTEEAGQTYYFCGKGCLEKFRADPAKYLAKANSPPPLVSLTKSETPKPQAEHTCPMHPEVRQNRPGSCPKCGMALEPLVAAIPAIKTEYLCPMHPEVVRAEPGSCPICGMALEPRVASINEEENPELVSMTRRFLGLGYLDPPNSSCGYERSPSWRSSSEISDAANPDVD